jgi:NAD(P)-binding Rossmann-like domain
MRKAVIIGASVGGLVAAAQLRKIGWDVTILEKGRTVGGLYAKVETPFGASELGMHVLYVTAEQQTILSEMCGAEAFIEKRGVAIDIGGTYNSGILNTDSIYPDARKLPNRALIEAQIRDSAGATVGDLRDAAQALRARFGAEAADRLFAPILQKLWKRPAHELSVGALHCYFDLRRVLVVDKADADTMKQDPALDAVIGNPLQAAPAGSVFGGRRALFFRSGGHDIGAHVTASLQRSGIRLELGSDVRIDDDTLTFNARPLSADFDACIIASPLAALDTSLNEVLEQIELSIFYIKVRNVAATALPVYYVLCQSQELVSSRIVNYAAYNFEKVAHLDELVAVEVLHEPGKAPALPTIATELSRVLPGLEVLDGYALPRSLKIASPTLNNARRLDASVDGLRQRSGFKLLHAVGMRTDKGVFFSHQTIGAAHAAALDCATRLP